MAQRNPFSLNLNFLKSQAKARLKLLKNQEAEQWKILRDLHPHSNLTPETIKLSDVQFVMARELGSPSWSKLKHHIEEQEKQKSAIEAKSMAPDQGLECLHIRCGHDIGPTLNKAGFIGDFLPWIDPYCVGYLSRDLKVQARERAHFVSEHYLSEMDSGNSSPKAIIAQDVSNWQTLGSDKYQRLVIWVEHDNYDQLMMIFLLANMPQGLLNKLDIIEVNQFPGSERYIGLGQLPAQSIRSCWSTRKPVGENQIKLAKQIWQALCDHTPVSLTKLLKQDLDKDFINIRAVLIRHLQQLPHNRTGLNLTRHLALNTLLETPSMTVGEWFTAYQQREPLPFLGDLMFWAMLKPLMQGDEPLVQMLEKGQHFYEHRFSLTEAGKHVLNGGRWWSSPVEFVGGISLGPSQGWMWDHQSLATLVSYSGK